ncbi:MAG: universal stress protein [Desulfobacterales bacterium]|nr:universal stress protein [Desulfobacterales bacterium]MDD4071238.1 universal stress protein [Desulfobacterales bacterium]MDD4393956.1 universal stress protein [Desulfobacterales bacterium]
MFEKILYPTDFSDVSKKALEFVKRLKGAGAREVILLHVIDKRTIESMAMSMYVTGDAFKIENDMMEYAKTEMSAMERELKQIGFGVKVLIEKEIPFREILRVEKQEKASIIVIGSHGKSNIEEMLLGSVSEMVVRKAEKPVLVIKR